MSGEIKRGAHLARSLSNASMALAYLLAALTVAIVIDAAFERPPDFMGPMRARMPDVGYRGLARGGSLYLLWGGLSATYLSVFWLNVLAGDRARSTFRLIARIAFSMLLAGVAATLVELVLYSAAQ
jgi:hypothetical protein